MYSESIGKSTCGFIKLPFLYEVTGRLGQEQKSSLEYEGPEKLDSDWNSIASRVITVLGGKDNKICKEDADRDAELVTSN